MDYKAIIITACTSILSSAASIVLTNIFLIRRDVFQINTSQRKNVYIEAMIHLEKINVNPGNIYNVEFINELQRNKVNIKLFGSKEVVKNYKAIWDYIMNVYEEYQIYEYDLQKKYNILETQDIFVKEDGEFEVQGYCPSESEINLFNSDLDAYKRKKLIDREWISKHINDLNNQMKKDLKSKK